MSSEVPELTFDAIDEIFDGFEASGQPWSPQQFARAIEQAVGAQWAAEVERLASGRNCWKDAAKRTARLFTDADDALLKMTSERDSAQAEAKRLRELLAAVLDLVPLREEFHYLDRGIGTKTASGVTLLSARAALQPGDNQAPRAGETA